MNIFLKHVLCFLAVAAAMPMYAQSYDADMYVFASAGRSDTIKTSSGTPQYFIDWTIGEPIVESLKGSKKQLTQGLHQSRISIPQSISTYVFSVLDLEQDKHFSVFPNPFVSNLSVQWNFSEAINLMFEVFTLEGKRIYSQHQNAVNSQLLITLSNLKPSTYVLRISDPQRNFVETHKIVKF